jgi:hypothetical protein
MTRSVPRVVAAVAAAATLYASGSPCLPAEPADPLWKRAVAIAGASEGWRPTRTVSRIEDLAKDGRVRSVDEVTFAYPPGSGEPKAELVRYLRDGVDVTAKERAKFSKQQQEAEARKKKGEKDGNSVTLGVSGTPFDPRRQSAVSIRRTEEKRTIDGRVCQAYEYSYADPAGGRSVGTAFLDEQTGAPLSTRERPDPLPRFADKVWIVLTFTYKGPGEWYPTRVDIEGSGGLLFIRKSIRTRIELLDFWRDPAVRPATP